VDIKDNTSVDMVGLKKMMEFWVSLIERNAQVVFRSRVYRKQVAQRNGENGKV